MKTALCVHHQFLKPQSSRRNEEVTSISHLFLESMKWGDLIILFIYLLIMLMQWITEAPFHSWCTHSGHPVTVFNLKGGWYALEYEVHRVFFFTSLINKDHADSSAYIVSIPWSWSTTAVYLLEIVALLSTALI